MADRAAVALGLDEGVGCGGAFAVGFAGGCGGDFAADAGKAFFCCGLGGGFGLGAMGLVSLQFFILFFFLIC